MYTVPKRARTSHENIKKGWSEKDTEILVSLVDRYADHKNKWKLVAAGMPEARTPGQVKEKFHRLQKSVDFAKLQERVLSSPRLPDDLVDEPSAVKDDLRGRENVSRLDFRKRIAPDGVTVAKQTEYQQVKAEEEELEQGMQRARSPSQDSVIDTPVGSRGSDRTRRIVKRPAASDDEWDWGMKPAKEPRLVPAHGTNGSALRLMRSKKSASGFRGVSRAGSRWEAYIGNGTSGKRYIGRFDTAEEAAEAYAEAFLKLNGRVSGMIDDEEDEDVDGMGCCAALKACIKCKRGHHTVAYCRRDRKHDGPNWDDFLEDGENEATDSQDGDEAGDMYPEMRKRRDSKRPCGLSLPIAAKPNIVLPEGVELIRSPHAASGFQGVSRAGSKWEAYISGGPGKVGKKYIGRFVAAEEAAAAYALEARRMRGTLDEQP